MLSRCEALTGRPVRSLSTGQREAGSRDGGTPQLLSIVTPPPHCCVLLLGWGTGPRSSDSCFVRKEC